MIFYQIIKIKKSDYNLEIYVRKQNIHLILKQHKTKFRCKEQ